MSKKKADKFKKAIKLFDKASYHKDLTKYMMRLAGYMDKPVKVRPLSANQKKALEVMERHLHGYTGLIAHGAWVGLRDDIVYLVEKRRVRKVK